MGNKLGKAQPDLEKYFVARVFQSMLVFPNPENSPIQQLMPALGHNLHFPITR